MIKRTAKSRKVSYLLPIIVIIGIFVISVGLYGFNLLPTPSSIGINQVTTNASGEVDLALSPTSITSQINDESTINLIATVGNAKLVVLTAELTYDPAKISTPTITQGDFLTNTLSSPKVENGKISFAFAASPDSGGMVGSGTVAIIKFKTIASGSSAISFSPTTVATALDLAGKRIPTNTLRSATDTTITVTAAATAAPTTTPTFAPTATPASNSVLVVTNTPKPTTRPRVVTTTTTTAEDTTSTSDTTYTDTTAQEDLIPITDEQTDTTNTTTDNPGFWRKVMIGWGIIIQYILSLFGIN